jgi:hypothetical protein
MVSFSYCHCCFAGSIGSIYFIRLGPHFFTSSQFMLSHYTSVMAITLQCSDQFPW